MPLFESQTRYVNFSQECQDYDESLKAFRDWYSVISTAERKGRNERSLEIARNLKRMAIPMDSIIAATGLAKEDIDTL